MSDQNLTHDSVQIVRNSTAALAAHLGLVLDQHGHTVTPPDGADLTETVAHLLHARHTSHAFDTWDELTVEGRTYWLLLAAEAIAVATGTARPDLAEFLRIRIDQDRKGGPWTSLDRGGRAPWGITAQHVVRLVQEAGA